MVRAISRSRSFAVWVIEMLFQAVGTSLWITTFAFVEALPGTRDDVSWQLCFGITVMVLLEFAMTGYLITTVFSALFLPRRLRFLYPFVSGALYLIHSGMFFVALGNRILDKNNLSTQIGGSCIAFAIALAGERLREMNRPGS